jgi:uncharacterized damage-inducible protein DinB
MNLRDYARTMSAYNRWMNEKLYAVCASLSPALRRQDLGAFFGSIHGTLNHLVIADRIWLGRFVGPAFPVSSLDEDRWPDFEDLRRERAAVDDAIEHWVNSLADDADTADLVYRSVVNPQERRVPLRLAAIHFFNHQTHHRGQVTTLLRQQGVDPGVTDLLWMPGASEL